MRMALFMVMMIVIMVMIMRMIVVMIAMRMIMMMFVIVFMVIVMIMLSLFFCSVYRNFYARSLYAAFYRRFGVNMNGGYADAVQPVQEFLRIFVQFKQGRHEHVARRAHVTFNIQRFHIISLSDD
jgi:hypothetical protein